MHGITAIAVSTAAEHGDASNVAYDKTAAKTASLIVGWLEAGMPVLRNGAVLNINYPVLSESMTTPKGIRRASIAPQSAAAFNYRPVDNDTYEIVPSRSKAKPAPGSDAALLAKGYVTVSLFSADRTVNSDRAALLERIVGKLK